MDGFSQRTFELSPRKRELLERLLQKENIGASPAQGISRRQKNDTLPLSFAQQRLWFLNQLEPDSAVYNTSQAVSLVGMLDLAALEQSFNEVVQRHEVLRTRFLTPQGQPVQRIADTLRLSLPLLDLSALSHSEREMLSEQLARQQAQRPFDLATGPLFRVTLLRLGKQEHILLLTLHHIICDGWSLGVLMRELSALYSAFVHGHPCELPELPLQYADYTLWQRDWLQGEVLQEHLTYWRTHLAGAPTVLALPSDHPRPAVQSYRGAWEPFRLPEALVENLKALSQQEGVTLFMTLLAAFAILLARWSGQTQVVVGAPIANRRQSELEGLIGCFVNTLALRVDLSGNPSVRELLARVREVAVQGYAHQDLPFEKLVEALTPQRDLSHTPLFQVLFVLQNTASANLQLPGVTLQPLTVESGGARCDLTLLLEESVHELAGGLEYNTDLFERETIQRLAGHLKTLLEAMVQEPQQRVAELPLLTKSERRQLLFEWNITPQAYQEEACLHQLFEAQVERTPDTIAAVSEDEHLSYRELNRRANQLAHLLLTHGAGPEVLVGLCLPRSLDILIAVLAILKAGGAYLPLDPDYPPQRLTFMLQDARPPLLLTRQTLLPRLSTFHGTLLQLDQDTSLLAEHPATNPSRPVLSQNLAYVIYTSGSTGQPKGVAITHQGSVQLLRWAGSHFTGEQLSGVVAATSLCFDLSLFELFAPLSQGGCVLLLENLLQLPQLPLAQRATLLNTVPSVLAQVLQFGSLPASIRTINLAGEPLPTALAQQVYQQQGVQALFNLYGPSEDTTYSTWAPVEYDQALPIVIGRPLPNKQAFILDGQLQLVPVGIVGELYLGGDGLARGYLHHPAMTANRFIPHPFSQVPGARLYRTGDLGRYLPDGTIEHVGRNDAQIKLRGYRIELGEIESTLRQHPQVQDTVVLVRENMPSDKSLVAYVASKQKPLPTNSDLRDYLQQHLPGYMVPSVFVLLETLPLTATGKIDRRALPTPARDRVQSEEGYVAPRNPQEELLVEIWSQVLGMAPIGVHDNFFALGGHSLLATQVVARLRTFWQMEVPLRTLFEAPTVAQLAQRIEQESHREQRLLAPSLRPWPRPARIPLSFGQQRLWFLDQLERGAPVYNVPIALRLTGVLHITALELSLKEIVKRHEILRTSFITQEGEPSQHIAAAMPLSLSLLDLSGLPTAEQEALSRTLVQQEATRPFDLAIAPLLRLHLLRLTSQEHILLINLHHTICDGWSLGVLLHELSTLYRAFAHGELSHLPELPLQYADYSLWQRDWLQESVMQEQLDYWQAHVAGVPSVLTLPTDHPRPTVQTYQGANLSFQLSQELTQGLKALSQREGVTLFMTLLAGFAILLSRYSGQAQFLIGTPIANRRQSELEGLIGFFVNTLALRADLSGYPNVHELLSRIRQEALSAYAHQDLPFEKLVEVLIPERDLSHAPLFQVLFVFQNTARLMLDLPEVSVEHLFVGSGGARCDLMLSLQESQQGLSGMLEYSTDLFEPQTIERMVGHLSTLLQAMVATPQQRIASLPLLTDPEHQLLSQWNTTQQPLSPHIGIHQLFEAQVQQTPDAIAVSFQDQHLSYDNLNRRANRLAFHLQALGVGPDVPVGLCLPRSLDQAVAVLAILKAGGAYVPLDPDYPPQRLAFMLADAGVSLLLTHSTLLSRLQSFSGTFLCLDQDLPLLAQQPTTNLTRPLSPLNLAYVIYTSGSTGRPKGVALPHLALTNLLTWHLGTLLAGVRTLQFASLSFDVSCYEMFVAWGSGGTLCLLNEQERRDLSQLAFLLSRLAIQKAILPVVVLQQLAQFYQAQGSYPTCLREITTTGEQQHLTAAVRQWFQQIGSCQLHNHYGPSESHVVSAYHLQGPHQHWPTTPPIGRPIANTRLYVLDAHLQPLPVGVIGELYIGGVNLARGYLGRADLTAERFVPHPFSESGGERLYRTGDLARYLPDGNIEYLGRQDGQVKLRGYRIEVAEIEEVLREHEQVQEAVVLLHTAEETDKQLVAYVQPVQGAVPSAKMLRSHLRQRVPDYMLPSVIMQLDSFPLSSNGKIDRRALPDPEKLQPEVQTSSPTPRTTVERTIAVVWREMLHVEKVGLHDNFFDLGGHSLLMIRVLNALREVLQKEISMLDLFKYPTISSLAEYLNQEPNEHSQAKMDDDQLEKQRESKNRMRQLFEHTRRGTKKE